MEAERGLACDERPSLAIIPEAILDSDQKEDLEVYFL